MSLLVAFGLQVASEVPPLVANPLGEAGNACNIAPDVCVEYGTRPQVNGLGPGQHGRVCWEIKPNFAIADVVDVGRFCVRAGCSIIVDVVTAADPNEVAMFTWGPAWRALLSQRGCWHLHGSAASVGDRAIVLTGSHTSGKSSLAAALVRRGWDFLTDDICVIDIDATVGVTVRPGFAWQKLWPDTLRALGCDPEQFRRLARSTPKRVVAAVTVSSARPLSAIYVIDPCDVATAEIVPALGHEKFRLLAQASMGDVDFRALCALAKGTPVWRLRRPLMADIPTADGELHRVADTLAVHAADHGSALRARW